MVLRCPALAGSMLDRALQRNPSERPARCRVDPLVQHRVFLGRAPPAAIARLVGVAQRVLHRLIGGAPGSLVVKLHGKLVIEDRPGFLEGNAKPPEVRGGLGRIPVKLHHLYIVWMIGAFAGLTPIGRQLTPATICTKIW